MADAGAAPSAAAPKVTHRKKQADEAGAAGKDAAKDNAPAAVTKTEAKKGGCSAGAISANIKNVIQVSLVGAAAALVIFFLFMWWKKSPRVTCLTEVPQASFGLGAALSVLFLSTLADLLVTMIGPHEQEKKPIALRACESLRLSLLGWGLVLGALGWLGYELFRNNMWKQMSVATPTACDPTLYRVMSYVAFALVGTVILYTILVTVVVSIACCCSSKFKPAGAGAKVWDGTLNFFGLRELMPVAPAAAKGKDGDEDDVEAGAGGADKDDAKAQKQPLLGGDDKKEKKDKKKKEKEVAVASGTPAAYAEGKPGSA